MDKSYLELIKSLKKEELLKIVNLFHQYCLIYNYPVSITISKAKKEDIINYIFAKLDIYVKCIIMSMDTIEFKQLKKTKEYYIPTFIDNYLIINNILTLDVKKIINKYLKNKKVVAKVKANRKIYNIASGIMICYGALKTTTFKELIGEEAFLLVAIRKNSNYTILDDKIIVNKLTNKRKINKYVKNLNIRKFSKSEYEKIGKNTYHHSFNAYKKLIKVLKSNYLFKQKDISFLDQVIIIPYLYNNTKEESLAFNNLNQIIDNYFEFGTSKLKERIISSIKLIKEEFPLWEYRGKSLKEESND